MKKKIAKANKWWLDKTCLKELDNRFNAWKSGKETGYTLDEVNASITLLKNKGKSK